MPGTTSTALPSFSHDQHHKTDAAKRKGGYIYQKKPRLKDRTDRAWFSRLLRHPARKRSRSILTTLELARWYLFRKL